MNKRCTKCGVVKPLELFKKAKLASYGRSSHCKACCVKYSVAYFSRDMKRKRAVQRKYYNSKKKCGKHAEDMKDPIKAARIREISRKARNRYPEKKKARETFQKAVRRGLIKRPDACSECFKVCKVDGHHTDYSKPFVVEWLCRACHRRKHILDTEWDGIKKEGV